jgi:hypothetical protein
MSLTSIPKDTAKRIKDLSVESLREFAGNYQDVSVAGGILPRIEIPFQISAREFLEFGAQDLREAESDRHVVNALSNTKRAIECQIDSLLVAFGLFSLSKSQKWNFPRKRETLLELGVVAPDVLKRITEKRNILEHEYARPKSAEVREALDVARLFIEATDVFMAREWRDIDVENLVSGDCLALTLDYKQGRMTLRSYYSGGDRILTAGSDNYLEYLRWFVPVMRKYG